MPTTTQPPASRVSFDDLLTEPQAAELIGVTRGTLRVSRTTGRLMGTSAPPWLKVGRGVRYSRATLQSWLNEVVVERHAPVASHG